MIDHTEIRRLIENKISGSSLTLPVEFENTLISPDDVAHIGVVLTDVHSQPACMGNSRMVNGMVVIEIYTKLGTGTKLARETASFLCDLLKGEDSVEGVIFEGGGELISMGASEGSSLYQHNLMIPYIFQYGN